MISHDDCTEISVTSTALPKKIGHFELIELPCRGSGRVMVHHVIHDDPPHAQTLNRSVPQDLEATRENEPDSLRMTTAQSKTMRMTHGVSPADRSIWK